MKKLVNKKGFTLIEMLIVVAIVGILVAIAVPTMSSSLDKAHAATDAANLRTAKSQLAQLVADPDQTEPEEGAIYDPEKGNFEGTVASGNTPSGCEGQCSAHSAAYITVYEDENGALAVHWAAADKTAAAEDCGSAE